MPIIVNGKTITDEMIENARQQLVDSSRDLKDAPEASDETVHKMVIDRALIQEYAASEVKTLPAGALRRKMKQVIEQFGGEAKYREALEQMNIDAASFESDVELGIKVDMVLDNLCKEISPPTEEELNQHFEENRGRFDLPARVICAIIVKHTPSVLDVAPAQEQMREIHKRLADGAAFGEMVWRYSDYKENEGVIGPLPRGVMPEKFDDVVFTLEEGALSDLIVLPRAIYIARMLQQLPAEPIAFEEAREQVLESCMLGKENATIDALAERLREGATIEFQ